MTSDLTRMESFSSSMAYQKQNTSECLVRDRKEYVAMCIYSTWFAFDSSIHDY